MAWTSATRARAKINLTLHITDRRDDGYHNLESLVAFADLGDDVVLVAGDHISLTINGPESAGLVATADNHILKAADALLGLKSNLRVGRFHVLKRLPIASGMGGGSADAAAALRLLAKLNDMSLDDPLVFEAARLTGADVPVCLASQARMMRGIGDQLDAPHALPQLFAVLLNPRIATATPDVFKAIGLQAGATHTSPAHDVPELDSLDGCITFLLRHRNDMQAAAIRLVPAIAEGLALLKSTKPLIARMSGSGATVFALYKDCRAAARAAKFVKSAKPEWWVRPTRLR
jgi:4-diphosphocytidyl-2-C-methyl-D-erythritol kinase